MKKLESKDYKTAAERKRDGVTLRLLDGAGHFELIAPQSPTWPAVEEAVRVLLGRKIRSREEP